MIYLLSREGQMCNQLISLSTVYSLGIEYHTNVTCPITDHRLKEYFTFDNTRTDIQIKTYDSLLFKLLYFLYKAYTKLTHHHSSAKFNKNKTAKNQYFFDRISFFEPEIFGRHTNDIRKFLDFQPKIKENCKTQIDKIREDDAILVGVHIRRGDYKEFQDGKWYYTDEEYIHWMCHLAEDKKVQFLICSNESINLELYKAAGLDVCRPGKSAIDDLCLLSMCSYVLGPPSTYSLWAAMIGNKKRWILDDRTCDVSWNTARYLEERIEHGETVR